MTLSPLDARVRDYLDYLAKPPLERVAIANISVEHQDFPAPWFDDLVAESAYLRGLTSHKVVSKKDIKIGDQVATDGRGKVWLVRLTERGKRFLFEHPMPVDA